jgi:hypothetical protein
MNFPQVQSAVAFIGHFLLVCAVLFWVSRSAPVGVRRAAALFSLILLLIPVNGLPIAGYMRGLIGDFSVTTTLLLGAIVLARSTGYDAGLNRARAVLLAGAAIAGLALYPFALGLTRFDSYQLGYESPWLLMAVFGFVVWTWRTHRAAAAVILCSTAAFNLGLLESTNLWDYLLDPWLVVFAWVWMGMKAWEKQKATRAPGIELGNSLPVETPGAISAVPESGFSTDR